MTKKEKVLMQKIYSMLQILSDETDKYYLKEATAELTEELRKMIEE